MSSFSGEPPRKRSNKTPSSPPSFFSPLPEDLVLVILARVPRRYHPILSCVCKSFRDLVRSPEIQKSRSLLGLDSLYIYFKDESTCRESGKWYTLRRIENNPTQNLLTSIDTPHPRGFIYSSVIAIGSEIFFFSGCHVASSSFFIFDSRSGTFPQGPDMLVERLFHSVGFVGEKVYAIGGYRGDDVFQAESFDLKKQIWEVVPILDEKWSRKWICPANVSLDRKVCALNCIDGLTCYDTGDGSCETFELPKDKWWRCGVCEIQNVLYVYFARFGLMWFDTELMLWRSVNGLSDLEKVRDVGMAEYYGKMAFLWEESGEVNGEVKEIWCRMIGLDKSGGWIHGTAEPVQLLGTFPRSYKLWHCLSVSD